MSQVLCWYERVSDDTSTVKRDKKMAHLAKYMKYIYTVKDKLEIIVVYSRRAKEKK